MERTELTMPRIEGEKNAVEELANEFPEAVAYVCPY
jgi:hypothetical protein